MKPSIAIDVFANGMLLAQVPVRPPSTAPRPSMLALIGVACRASAAFPTSSAHPRQLLPVSGPWCCSRSLPVRPCQNCASSPCA